MSDFGKSKGRRDPRAADRDAPPVAGDRIPPHNLEAEQGLLAAIILEGGGDIFAACREAKIRPEYFFNSAHQIIFEAMEELVHAGKSVDDITLPEILNKKGELSTVGGTAYINELTRRIEVTAFAAHWMEIVREKFKRRKIITTALNTVEQAFRADASVDDVLEGAEMSFFELGKCSGDPVEPFSDTVEKAEKRFEDALAGRVDDTDEWKKITWGFECLDRHFHKINVLKGDFLIGIDAEGGVGKSSFVDNIIAANLAAGKSICKHSLETSNMVTAMSLAALYSGIPLAVADDVNLLAEQAEKLRRQRCATDAEIKAADGNFFEANDRAATNAWEKAVGNQRAYFRFLKQISGKTFFAYDHTREFTDIVSMTRQADRAARAEKTRQGKPGGLDLVVVDYLQEIDVQRDKFDREDQILDRIGRDMKGLAKKLKCPVILIMSKNRAGGVRGSGGVFFIVDRQISLERPEERADKTPNKATEKNPICEVFISQANKRNVPGWREKMHFHGPLKRFIDISRFTRPGEYAAAEEAEAQREERRGRPKGVKNGEGRARQQSVPKYATHDDRPWSEND